MITSDQLKSLYESKLKAKLSGLETLRKGVLRRRVVAALFFVSALLFALPIAILLDQNGLSEVFVLLFTLPFILVGLVFSYFAWKRKKEYRVQFKEGVVREIVNAIDPEWKYFPDESISQGEYRQSDIFRHPVDRYRGDDLIVGKIEKTDFRCSELHTEYKTVTTDKEGRRKETWHTIFRGLLFHADFNKQIKGKTYVEPDTAERLFGKFGQSLQTSSKGKLVKLENPEFEKIFAVFATDQTEARYILTPTMMEALVNIQRVYKRKLHISFIGSRVYVAMSFNRNLFEPSIIRSGVKFKDVEFMFNLFRVNQTIIHELNLNTRIWTKE